eukprot:30058-Pelagococcus_subviridis.AAC.1
MVRLEVFGQASRDDLLEVLRAADVRDEPELRAAVALRRQVQRSRLRLSDFFRQIREIPRRHRRIVRVPLQSHLPRQVLLAPAPVHEGQVPRAPREKLPLTSHALVRDEALHPRHVLEPGRVQRRVVVVQSDDVVETQRVVREDVPLLGPLGPHHPAAAAAEVVVLDAVGAAS